MVWLAFFGGVFVGMLLAEFFYGIVEVFAALGEHAGDFDLEAITAHLVEHDNVPYDQASQTFHLAIDVDELWAVLFRYDMSGIALDKN